MKQTIMAVIMVLAMVSGAWAEPEPLQFYPIINVTSETCELDCTYEKPCPKEKQVTRDRIKCIDQCEQRFVTKCRDIDVNSMFTGNPCYETSEPIHEFRLMAYEECTETFKYYYFCEDGKWREKESMRSVKMDCKTTRKYREYNTEVIDNPFKEGE